MSRWIAMHCGEETTALIARHPNAFLLLCQIAMRAKWKDCPITNMKAGEAFIGDWKEAGLESEAAYRHAKKVLLDCHLATFRGTNKGTRSTLMDTSIFSITKDANNGQSDRPATHQQRTNNGQSDRPTTTNHTETQNTPTTQSTLSLALDGQEPDAPPHPHGKNQITPEEIYQAYPRHTARPKAMQAITKARKKNTAEFLMERTKAYAEAMKGTDPKFIPHPASWFNQERFNDAPVEWNPEAAPPRTQTQPAAAAIAAEIVDLYPRREKTAEAVQIVAADIAAGIPADTIKDNTRAHAAAMSMLPGGGLNGFLPNAAKFFKERRWQDDPKTWLRSCAKGSTGAPHEPYKPGGRKGTTITLSSHRTIEPART